MAELTKNGVCYNLPESPYYTVTEHFTFYFSNIYHKRKFDGGLIAKQEWLSDSLTRRFKLRMTADDLAALHFYRQVETRGFFVVDVYGREYRSIHAFEGDVVIEGEDA